MAVAPVYEFAVPAPHDEDLVDGEMALAVASPMNTAAGDTTFHLSRWFDFDGGFYTFKAVADDSAVWIAAIEQSNGRILFSSTVALGVVEYQVYVPRGRQRLDLILVNMSSGASDCWVAFSIWKASTLLYASAGEAWVFDTAPIDDADVPDIGDRRLTYPLFSIMPNWRDGITERLTYNTEVLASENDSEQRRGIRRYPRRSVEAEFARWEINRARLDIFIASSGKNEILVPLWHEQFVLQETLGSSLEFPEGSLVMREFQAGTLVAVIDSPTSYEILEIDTADIETDIVTFVDAPVGTWPAGSKIFPVRVARTLDVAQFNNPTDGIGKVSLRFSFEETETWPDPDWGYCVPYFRFRVNRATDIETELNRLVYTLDNETGVVDIVDASERERVAMRCSLMLKGRRETYAFRQFMQQARGQALRFWIPDHMRDLFLATPVASGSYIDVVNSGYFDLMKYPQEVRRTFGVFFKDGRPAIYRDIENVARVGDVDRLTVDRVMPSIVREDIERISFIIPVRFEQDAFELKHHVDDSAAITLGVAVRSTDRGDLPDIECFVTSRPYPIDFIEALDVTAALTGGELRFFRYDPEGLDADAEFTFGQLRSPLIGYSMVEEAMDVDAEFTFGQIRSPLIGYSMVEEAMDVDAEFYSGALRVALIDYDEYQPEALDTSAAFVGGTLS